ncbi:PREDICTED: uncharacterized protein LOC106808427 isoform X2 [Priapulus caudatus]|uniref:Uncharacterized protein LOC106808427 isoform X2 n=1 Tax=Priapulus caudatus TaxID=37621 RepID=A0ABM1E362_PRICU|nr:PREDICTED: uncharacterized protein LOC106808427 isoform X2 [Priapulus caudatus]
MLVPASHIRQDSDATFTLTMPAPSSVVKQLWETTLDHNFNTLNVASVFRHSGLHLIVGCEDGTIRIYNLPLQQTKNSIKKFAFCLQLKSQLDSKGGPIQMMAVHDVTRFSSNDLLVADSHGTLTVFCNEQILHRQRLSDSSINCLQVEQDASGKITIVASDGDGCLLATHPHKELWKIRLPDIMTEKSLRSKPVVTALLCVQTVAPDGKQINYILASDSYSNVHVLQQGKLVMSIPTPSRVNAMCCGRFKMSAAGDSDMGATAAGAGSKLQVALATDTGVIYIMEEFQLCETEYCAVGSPVTQLCRLSARELGNADVLLAAGHYNALAIYQDGKLKVKHQTSDWICSVIAADMDNDNHVAVVVGCYDRTISALRINI